jgi:hypothetical protein
VWLLLRSCDPRPACSRRNGSARYSGADACSRGPFVNARPGGVRVT